MNFRPRPQAKTNLGQETLSTFEVAGDDGATYQVVADSLTPDGVDSAIGHIETTNSQGETHSFIGSITRKIMEAGRVEIQEIIHPSDDGSSRNKFIAGVAIAGAVIVGTLRVWHNKDH
jgi:hypothetical protein